MPSSQGVEGEPGISSVVSWYDVHRRDLPWRRPGTTPWSVLVSEVMLQQTPVDRVVPVHERWLRRWPRPGALAAAPTGDAIRDWGLGYPRRALRLHQAAGLIETNHDDEVPDEYDDLRALPGVGDYTAAAVLAFGFRRRITVLDTNVRRVLARAFRGEAGTGPTPSRIERELAERLLPEDAATAVAWSQAVMELGALLCRARAPACDACPLITLCRWRAAGHPQGTRTRPSQPWEGTDRQCRGRLLAAIAQGAGPISCAHLVPVWPDADQRDRCLNTLVADGLIISSSNGEFALPQ